MMKSVNVLKKDKTTYIILAIPSKPAVLSIVSPPEKKHSTCLTPHSISASLYASPFTMG
jgi:hypothetical protein